MEPTFQVKPADRLTTIRNHCSSVSESVRSAQEYLPKTHSQPRVVIDHLFFPHILEEILNGCDSSTLIAVSQTCKAYRNISQAYRHLVCSRHRSKLFGIDISSGGIRSSRQILERGKPEAAERANRVFGIANYNHAWDVTPSSPLYGLFQWRASRLRLTRCVDLVGDLSKLADWPCAQLTGLQVARICPDVNGAHLGAVDHMVAAERVVYAPGLLPRNDPRYFTWHDEKARDYVHRSNSTLVFNLTLEQVCNWPRCAFSNVGYRHSEIVINFLSEEDTPASSNAASVHVEEALETEEAEQPSSSPFDDLLDMSQLDEILEPVVNPHDYFAARFRREYEAAKQLLRKTDDLPAWVTALRRGPVSRGSHPTSFSYGVSEPPVASGSSTSLPASSKPELPPGFGFWSSLICLMKIRSEIKWTFVGLDDLPPDVFGTFEKDDRWMPHSERLKITLAYQGLVSTTVRFPTYAEYTAVYPYDLGFWPQPGTSASGQLPIGSRSTEAFAWYNGHKRRRQAAKARASRGLNRIGSSIRPEM